MKAEVAEQLEKSTKGERFSVIEPPLLPEKQIKPNRPAIHWSSWCDAGRLGRTRLHAADG
jgi:hypothetical protein